MEENHRSEGDKINGKNEHISKVMKFNNEIEIASTKRSIKGFATEDG